VDSRPEINRQIGVFDYQFSLIACVVSIVPVASRSCLLTPLGLGALEILSVALKKRIAPATLALITPSKKPSPIRWRDMVAIRVGAR
jgi:hypothetical protein